MTQRLFSLDPALADLPHGYANWVQATKRDHIYSLFVARKQEEKKQGWGWERIHEHGRLRFKNRQSFLSRLKERRLRFCVCFEKWKFKMNPIFIYPSIQITSSVSSVAFLHAGIFKANSMYVYTSKYTRCIRKYSLDARVSMLTRCCWKYKQCTTKYSCVAIMSFSFFSIAF